MTKKTKEEIVDYDGGRFESVEKAADKLEEMFTRLLEKLAEKEVLTTPDIYWVIMDVEDETAVFINE